MCIAQAVAARLTHFSSLFLVFLLLCFSHSQAISAVAGDVAPQGVPDNLLTAADIILVQKFVSGELVPTVTEAKLSDVYPLGAADGFINGNDVTLLNQALLGQATLPAVTLVAAPTLTNPGFSSTISNPIPISGTALANSTVHVYVNGVFQDSAIAATNGSFTVNTALVDGANAIFAITVNAGTPSPNSNSFNVSYTNTVSRVQSGSISGNVVWTPGSPAQVYTVTGSDLVVPAGAKLVIQPGTEVQFASGRKLTVNGTLSVRGGQTNKVKLISSVVSPTRGAWNGIAINNTATSISIENAIIESTTQAIFIDGVAAKIKNNTIRYFSLDGIYIKNTGANTSLIQGNTIDNINDTLNCLTTDTSSPTITGNTLTNCLNGLYINGNASPIVNGNNIITGNSYGVRFNSGALTTLPIITGNQIFSNPSYNVYTSSGFIVSGEQSIKLNFTGNWWGSADATVISNTIFDLSDNPVSMFIPTVDYSNFLNAAGGAPVAGNYLIGPLTATATTLTANATYNVLGFTFVPAGKTLTIPAGTILKFYGSSQLIVDGGVLNVQGTSGNKVTLTSGRAVPARGDWKGIWIKSTSGSIIDNAIIDYTIQGILLDGVAAQIKNNTIRNFSMDGIYVKNIGANAAVIQGNTVDNINDTFNCLTIDVSSPTITGNTLTNCLNGLYISGNSSPTVNGNNIITSNSNGIAFSAATLTTLPLITGNQIFNNSTFNFYTNSYAAGANNIKLNATGNWWGTTDPTIISNSIKDLTDDVIQNFYPTVDYSNYLNAANGTQVTGNYLIGQLTATTTTLTAGAIYNVLGATFVPAGKTLTIPAGITLKFHGTSQLIVDGVLTAQGTSGSKINFTSGRANPAVGNWKGIWIKTSAGSIIDNAIVEYATQAILLDGVAAQIKNSRVRYFNADGVYVKSIGANASLIQGNTIDNLNDTVNCLSVDASSPSIIGNTLTNCMRGLNISGNASPVVNGNNIITSNSYGVAFNAATLTTLPVITGNQIFSNTNFGFYTNGYVAGALNIKLNATGNWWGTTDPLTISNSIYDLTDNPTFDFYPTVDYSNYLNASNGTQVTGNYLIGQLTAAATTLTAGATYHVLGATFVPTGKTLTIPAGTILKFHGGASQLIVDGVLTVQGTSNNKVTLTSGRTIPSRGDWAGISLKGGAGSIIDNAIIEYTTQGVLLNGVAAQIKNSIIRYFNTDGIYVKNLGANTSLIQTNTIDNVTDTGNCITTDASSPTITGNNLQNCNNGLHIFGNASPTVNGNNIITSNVFGVRFNNGALTTLPVITGNQIFNNSNYNYEATNFAAGAQNLKHNANANWWGSTDPTVISSKIYDLTDAPTATTTSTVDYSNFLSSATGAPKTGNYLIGQFSATSTILTAGATYDVLGAIFVPAGKSLTIPAGTTLKFHGPSQLLVDGTLNVQGTSGNKVILTSGRAIPARGDWKGIWVKSGTGSSIDNATVEYTTVGVFFDGIAAQLKNSMVRYFSVDGVYVKNTGANASVIQGNTIDNFNDTVHCLTIDTSSPTISSNTIKNCAFGLYFISNASPAVSGNIITSNASGIMFSGGELTTQPVITGNQIFNNADYNLSIGNFVAGAQNIKLNATGNWWGSTDPGAISVSILDINDAYPSPNFPTVDYSNFLNGAGGTVIAGNYLIGQLTATATTLIAGATYDVLGSVFVPAGKTLTIPAKTNLRFIPKTRLVVNGSLNLSGTLNNEVVLTSAKILSGVSDWVGLEIKSDAAAVNIQNAIIQYADKGISIDNTAIVVNVSDSLIQFSNNGVYINGNTKPVIAKTRIVSNASYGIVINGTGNNATDPKPVLKNNDVYNNASNQNIQVSNYTASPTIKIDVTNSWWGSATPTFVSTALNYAPVLPSASLAPIATTHTIVNNYFSPNADLIQDTSNLSAALSEAASWVVDVKNLSTGTIIRTYTGNSLNAISAWDGKNSNAQTMGDGRYGLLVRSTVATRSGIALYKDVVLDNTAPTSAFDSLLAVAPQSNLLNASINGSANDLNFLNYSVDYTNNLTPVIWNSISGAIAQSISNSLLTSWAISNTVGNPVVANGTYNLRLTTKDLAGNQSFVYSPVTIDNLTLTAVNAPTAVNLRTNSPAAINFTMSLAGSVTVKIYDITTGPSGTPIRTLTSTAIAGVNTINWNGLNEQGVRVTGSAYIYVIEASDASHYGRYDPTSVVVSAEANFGAVGTICDVYRNVFAAFSLTTPQPGLAGVQLTTPNGIVYPFGEGGKPVPAGATTLYWDCRDPLTGAIVAFPANQMSAFTRFPLNTIFVDGLDGAAKIKGSGANVEVKSNPYLIYLSFAQFTKISYNLELFNAQNTLVEIKLLPPTVLSFNDPLAVLIFSGVQSAGDHELTWKGYVGTIENAKRATTSTEGAYTFAIKTTTNGVSSLYRGTLSVYQ